MRYGEEADWAPRDEWSPIPEPLSMFLDERVNRNRSFYDCQWSAKNSNKRNIEQTKKYRKTVPMVAVAPLVVPLRPACPVCGGPLVEIKQKLQCAQCRTICETCCEGGRG